MKRYAEKVPTKNLIRENGRGRIYERSAVGLGGV